MCAYTDGNSSQKISLSVKKTSQNIFLSIEKTSQKISLSVEKRGQNIFLSADIQAEKFRSARRIRIWGLVWAEVSAGWGNTKKCKSRYPSRGKRRHQTRDRIIKRSSEVSEMNWRAEGTRTINACLGVSVLTRYRSMEIWKCKPRLIFRVHNVDCKNVIPLKRLIREKLSIKQTNYFLYNTFVSC